MIDDDEFDDEFEIKFDDPVDEPQELRELHQLGQHTQKHLLSELSQKAFMPVAAAVDRGLQPARTGMRSLSDLYKQAQEQKLLSPQPNYT